MSKQRRFTKEFETESVLLAETSGRTQREIAEDLGVGLSTLALGMLSTFLIQPGPARKHSNFMLSP